MQRDCIDITLPDGRAIPLTRVRDPRAKRLKLTVTERGARLSVPQRASLASANAFVDQHLDWLTAQVDAVAHAAPLQPGHTTHLPLRGQSLPLDWRQGRFVHLTHAGNRLCFSCPDNVQPAALARAAHDFYAAKARADIARWLPKYLPGLPRPPSRIRLRVLSSQWGSLAPDGTLSLDLALVLGQASAFEYVLVHELCHLIHANHSPAFWHEVETRCPNWRIARDYFRSQGRLLKAQLHALLRGL